MKSMEQFEIIWHPSAKKQLIDTLSKDQTNLRNNTFLKFINSAVQNLASFPLLGKPTDFDAVRVLVLKNHSVFYIVLLNQIHIVLFWDNRRNLSDFKTELEKGL
jgi:plasmid stabilization system protein ParE